MLDRPQPAHGQLLRALVGVAEGGVVGLHDEHPGAAVDDVADQPVVDDLEADEVAQPGAADVEDPDLVARRAKSRRTRSTLSLKNRKKRAARARTRRAGTGCRLT